MLRRCVRVEDVHWWPTTTHMIDDDENGTESSTIASTISANQVSIVVAVGVSLLAATPIVRVGRIRIRKNSKLPTMLWVERCVGKNGIGALTPSLPLPLIDSKRPSRGGQCHGKCFAQ